MDVANAKRLLGSQINGTSVPEDEVRAVLAIVTGETFDAFVRYLQRVANGYIRQSASADAPHFTQMLAGSADAILFLMSRMVRLRSEARSGNAPDALSDEMVPIFSGADSGVSRPPALF